MNGDGIFDGLKRLAGPPIKYEDPHLGIKASFKLDDFGHLKEVTVTCPCGEEAVFIDFNRFQKQFQVREWINALTDDDLHEIGRAWDAAFRDRGPGRMKAQESVRAALFRHAPGWSEPQ